MAAIRTEDSDYSVDSWYGIDEVSPFAEFRGDFADGTDYYFLNRKYFLNEQTFVNVRYADLYYDSGFGFSGSYLFGNNFFLGFSAGELSDVPGLPPFSPAFPLAWEAITISAGYRFNLGEKSFLAASIGYWDPDYFSDEDYFLDLYGKFYFDNARVKARITLPEDSDIEYYFLNANFQIIDNLVIGATYEGVDSDSYLSAGFTWKPEPFIIDGEIGEDYYDKTYYTLSGMYCINENNRFDVEVYKYEDIDALFTVKYKYTNDAGSFNLAYTFDNDDISSDSLTLSYAMFFE